MKNRKDPDIAEEMLTQKIQSAERPGPLPYFTVKATLDGLIVSTDYPELLGELPKSCGGWRVKLAGA